MVSDGENTCSGDPCAVARTLSAAKGTDFEVHTVGFRNSSGSLRDQLMCIADATGGPFISVDDGAGLTKAIDTIVQAPPAAAGQDTIGWLDGAEPTNVVC